MLSQTKRMSQYLPFNDLSRESQQQASGAPRVARPPEGRTPEGRPPQGPRAMDPALMR